uniref:Endonuclease/exonuclease/phosphatase domain-containing protein n=1 Tax=Kalanchoe fedtschenkoi TaxID=63787 RepID=A0A7N0ZS43_KALFE
MMNSIIWNARGISNKETRYHLSFLISKYNPMILNILEPKANSRKIKNLSKKLGFNNLFYDHEVNNHIVVMWKMDVDLSIVYCDDQMATFKGNHSRFGQEFYLSIIYALCSKHARRRIWEGLLDLSNQIKVPWIVGGDFNVISNWNEKIGGRLVDDGSMKEFNCFIIQSGLIDISLNTYAFSWTNNHQGSSRIYKKLDRVFINSEAMFWEFRLQGRPL